MRIQTLTTAPRAEPRKRAQRTTFTTSDGVKKTIVDADDDDAKETRRTVAKLDAAGDQDSRKTSGLQRARRFNPKAKAELARLNRKCGGASDCARRSRRPAATVR